MVTDDQPNQPTRKIMTTQIEIPSAKRNVVFNFGAWTIKAEEIGRFNNDKYSRAYHRRYGGVWEIEARRVTFTRPWGAGTRTVATEVDSWRGDYLARAVVDAGLAPKKHHAPKAVRLHDAYDARRVGRIIDGITVYQRTILGAGLDYAARQGGVTYHAATAAAARAGLLDKISAHAEPEKTKFISFESGRRLGFCEAGMHEFCEIVQLDWTGTYTPAQVRDAIARVGFAAVAHYAGELETLGRACGVAMIPDAAVAA